jgi:urease accessory protein
LAYLHDHVLDDMVRELGYQVTFAAERFEPESGAYGHGHAHASRPPGGHSHGHDHHEHGHDHEHRPGSARTAHALP